ncbi:hypothetical protein [Shimia sp. NS0008-38b]|uniref:hypothetical protein n=1 Tax=Shimia sp. NS0008-38b TaxID=3127653 RepID=UPI003341E932
MRGLKAFISVNLKLLFVVSLIANLSLGVLNFVLQPIWRAAGIATALAAAEVKSEIEEKRAVAKARSREKAKARLRRMAVAVPVVGIALASAFEYVAYQEWLDENRGKTFEDYGAEVMLVSRDVAPEVVDEIATQMPAWMVPDADILLANLEKALSVPPKAQQSIVQD